VELSQALSAAVAMLTDDLLTELRDLSEPSENVVNLLLVVYILLNAPIVGRVSVKTLSDVEMDMSWKQAVLPVLAEKLEFRKQLASFGKHILSYEFVEAAQERLSEVHSDETGVPRAVPLIYKAVGLIVDVQIKFTQNITPLEEEIAQVEQDLRTRTLMLDKYKNKLTNLRERIKDLSETFLSSTRIKNEQNERVMALESRFEEAQLQLRAIELTRFKWEARIASLKEEEQKIFSSCVFHHAIFRYLGSFSVQAKQALLLELWPQAIRTSGLSFASFSPYPSIISATVDPALYLASITLKSQSAGARAVSNSLVATSVSYSSHDLRNTWIWQISSIDIRVILQSLNQTRHFSMIVDPQSILPVCLKALNAKNPQFQSIDLRHGLLDVADALKWLNANSKIDNTLLFENVGPFIHPKLVDALSAFLGAKAGAQPVDKYAPENAPWNGPKIILTSNVAGVRMPAMLRGIANFFFVPVTEENVETLAFISYWNLFFQSQLQTFVDAQNEIMALKKSYLGKEAELLSIVTAPGSKLEWTVLDSTIKQINSGVLDLEHRLRHHMKSLQALIDATSPMVNTASRISLAIIKFIQSLNRCAPTLDTLLSYYLNAVQEHNIQEQPVQWQAFDALVQFVGSAMNQEQMCLLKVAIWSQLDLESAWITEEHHPSRKNSDDIQNEPEDESANEADKEADEQPQSAITTKIPLSVRTFLLSNHTAARPPPVALKWMSQVW
jgi:hypothetical protein